MKPASAQTLYKIRGTVYDSSHLYPVSAVTVLSSSGRGGITDIDGKYVIEVTEKDSIWFSYLNKPTKKFPIAKIVTPLAFDISIQVSVPVLEEVKVRQRNYKQDSMQNRVDYAKIFNYQKPGLRPSVSSSGVGFDLDEIINMFRFRRNKSMLSFQQRLVREEQEKYVEHRFNRGLVRRLTQLDGDSLEYFMVNYIPPYSFTVRSDDYTFQKFIKDSGIRFRKGLLPYTMFKEEEEE